MGRTADVALAVIVVVCLAALLADASVGLFADASGAGPGFKRMIAEAAAFLLGAGAVVVAGILILRTVALAQPDEKRRARRRGFIAAAALVATAVLCWTDVPVRIAFGASRGAFDGLVATLPSATMGRRTPLLRQVGLYRVDAFAVDAAGGTYFRVGSSSLVDTTSWGFCYKPDPKTSPFGAAGYRLTALSDGWYWFTANDDWY